MIELKNLEERDGLYYVGHIADIDGDGWVTLKEAESIIASINKSNYPKELIFWQDGPWQYEDYEVSGGYFIRNGLKDFLTKLVESGKYPVGIKVDMESMNLEVIVKH